MLRWPCVIGVRLEYMNTSRLGWAERTKPNGSLLLRKKVKGKGKNADSQAEVLEYGNRRYVGQNAQARKDPEQGRRDQGSGFIVETSLGGRTHESKRASQKT